MVIFKGIFIFEKSSFLIENFKIQVDKNLLKFMEKKSEKKIKLNKIRFIKLKLSYLR